MLFPYRDDNPRILVPYVTYTILALNILVFIYQHILLDPVSRNMFSLRLGLIPAYFWGGDGGSIVSQYGLLMREHYGRSLPLQAELLTPVLTLFTSAFLHGGWLHIISNMLFLYVFADNVEGALGHKRFVLFYLLAILAAGLAHLLVMPGSTLPVIGASGAVSGVLGGYLVRYPRARIHVFVFIVIFFTTLRLPAYLVLGWWFLVQLISGVASLGGGVSGGTAWFEHIGGFIMGVLFMILVTRFRKFSRTYAAYR